MTVGRNKITVTITGLLVYYFDLWARDQAEHESIVNVDCMVPASIRLNLDNWILCLPDEIGIGLSGQRLP